MLKHTFIHIPKVGRATERKIWESGVRTWEDAVGRGAPGVPSQLLEHFLNLSFYALKKGEIGFFLEMLPSAEIWRLLVTPLVRLTGMARRQDELGMLDGYDAVTLWRLHKRGVKDALPTLLRYIAEDVVSLKPLLELACRMSIEQMHVGFSLPEVSERVVPEMPYSIELIRRLREERL